jgi:hypothetical protein
MRQRIFRIPRARPVGLALAAALLLSLALVGFANRRIPSSATISFPGRPLGVGDTVDWDFHALAPLPAQSVAVSGTWAVRAEGSPESSSGALAVVPAGRATTPTAARGAVCQTTGSWSGLRPVDYLLLDKRFPLLVLGEAVFEDVRVEARFRLLKGLLDQAAGIAFRIRNQDEYYVVRASAVEGNVNLYRFLDGRRALISEAPAAIYNDVWHTLVVEARGSHIEWSLDARSLGQVDDLTFRRGGGLGLWTRADSVSCFEHLRARAL